jgi:hypothetical protein
LIQRLFHAAFILSLLAKRQTICPENSQQ